MQGVLVGNVDVSGERAYGQAQAREGVLGYVAGPLDDGAGGVVVGAGQGAHAQGGQAVAAAAWTAWAVGGGQGPSGRDGRIGGGGWLRGWG